VRKTAMRNVRARRVVGSYRRHGGRMMRRLQRFTKGSSRRFLSSTGFSAVYAVPAARKLHRARGPVSFVAYGSARLVVAIGWPLSDYGRPPRIALGIPPHLSPYGRLQ
jgi:hypothetical protein